MSTNNIGNMDVLALRLGLPHRYIYNISPEIETPQGLPINSLPGWESIPLDSKLPMLKCPDNQVIFSKNKIGRSHENKEKDFDAICLDSKMDYNPLHDRHLRRFYSNKKLLKRLRENGEITENNDVICTLKQFNHHRLLLHDSYVSHIGLQRIKQNEEIHDRHMIAHAERIAERDRLPKSISLKGQACNFDIIQRKAELFKMREQEYKLALEKKAEKLKKIEYQKTIDSLLLKHKMNLHNLRIKHVLDVGIDFQRRRLIALKKHLQYKSDRLKKNIKKTKEQQMKMAAEKAALSWEKHLQERIMKQDKYKGIKKDFENEIRDWITDHMAYNKNKWTELHNQLQHKCISKGNRKSRLKKKIKRRKQSKETQVPTPIVKPKNKDKLEGLTSQDIYNALKTAIDIEEIKNVRPSEQYDANNYIYKAAKYILEDILSKFDKDLTGDKDIESTLNDRISRLFVEVKQYVLKRATQVISTNTNSSTNVEPRRVSFGSIKKKRYSLPKGVLFNSMSTLIGTGSYALAEGSTIKLTNERPPTPASSLTSIVIEEEDPCGLIKQRKSFYYLSRDERIFVEHLFIKLKRELIVGIGKQVMAAIECHQKNKILNVRKEIQDIDRKFLVKVMTRSILSYAVNKFNFFSSTLLCQKALAGDIILFLQKNLLKPNRDPRCIVQPTARSVCPRPPPDSKYC